MRGALLLIALPLAGCGKAPAPAPAAALTLAPVAVVLPADDEYFEGPDADLLNAHCTACHGATMILYQPPQGAEQWEQTVAKMRQVYKAPIEEADVPGIVRALAALSRE